MCRPRNLPDVDYPCVSPSPITATGAGILAITLWANFCGYMQPEPKIPVYWKFLHYFNMIRYSFTPAHPQS